MPVLSYRRSPCGSTPFLFISDRMRVRCESGREMFAARGAAPRSAGRVSLGLDRPLSPLDVDAMTYALLGSAPRACITRMGPLLDGRGGRGIAFGLAFMGVAGPATVRPHRTGCLPAARGGVPSGVTSGYLSVPFPASPLVGPPTNSLPAAYHPLLFGSHALLV